MNNPQADKILADCDLDLDGVQASIISLGIISNVTPYLTKYGIIRACGAIENSYKTIIADYCAFRTKIQVKNFLTEQVRNNSSNPSYNNICAMLNKFDNSWKNQFKEMINNHSNASQIQLSLKSLVQARNSFAHGGNPSASIQDIIQYYTDSKEYIIILDDIIK